MRRFLMRRLVLLVFVVWGVVSVTFVVTLKAGDPAAFMYHIRETKEEIEELRRRLGLDRPLHEQYVNYMFKAVRGDFGSSIRHRQPAMALIWGPSSVHAAIGGAGAHNLLLSGAANRCSGRRETRHLPRWTYNAFGAVRTSDSRFLVGDSDDPDIWRVAAVVACLRSWQPEASGPPRRRPRRLSPGTECTSGAVIGARSAGQRICDNRACQGIEGLDRSHTDTSCVMH